MALLQQFHYQDDYQNKGLEKERITHKVYIGSILERLTSRCSKTP